NYLNSVTAWIGGRYHRIRTEEGERNNVQVSTYDQNRALEFLRDRFITPPRWLLENPATGRLGYEPTADIRKLQEQLMEQLVLKAITDGSPDHLDRLCEWIFQQSRSSQEAE